MSPDEFRRLIAAGLTSEQVAVVMEMFDARDEDRKAGQRARWRKHQENKKNTNVSEREQTLANVPHDRDTRGLDNSLTQKIEPQESKKEQTAQARDLSGFDPFWTLYPNKVGKADASKAFSRAKGRAPLETIMAGLERYVVKTDDRPWCNPATWLNQDRWADQPAKVVPFARGSPSIPRTAADFLFAETMESLNGNARQNGPETVDWPDAGEFPGVTVSGATRRLGIPSDG